MFAACYLAIEKALRHVEWIDGRCPWCKRRKAEGHTPNCEHEDALLAIEGMKAMRPADGPERMMSALAAVLARPAILAAATVAMLPAF